jgi:hypothetical protein
MVKVALVLIACDCPAARALCGFKYTNATKGCSNCDRTFPAQDDDNPQLRNFSGFTKEDEGTKKTHLAYKAHAKKYKNATTIKARNELAKASGFTWTVLLRLPYYDAIQTPIVDPMHTLFTCVAKTIVTTWINKKILNKKALTARLSSMYLPTDVGRLFIAYDTAKGLGK